MLQVETVNLNPPALGVATLVRVRGDIDIASAQGLSDVLSAASSNQATCIIVSLEECHYFDSSGLAVLVCLHKSIGSRLKVIVRPNTTVSRIFEITSLDRALNVASSMAGLFDGTAFDARRIAG